MSTRTPKSVDGALPLQNSVSPELLPTLPATHDLIQRWNVVKGEDNFLEIGRAFVVLKAGCTLREFFTQVDAAGLSRRQVNTFMAAFRRLSSKPAIVEAVKVRSKAFALLPLDDEQLEELAVTGRTGSLVLSEITTMKSRDICATARRCRDERRQAAAMPPTEQAAAMPPTELTLIQRYIAEQGKDDFLEIGRALAALKASQGKGKFYPLAEAAGFSRSHAKDFVKAFHRLSNKPEIARAVKTRGKAFELRALDDDQLEELAVKGRVGPLALSEIPSMTVMGVREAVRKVQKEHQQATDALLDEKNRQLDAERARHSATPDALQVGDRVESLLARRPGAVVKIYADGSGCVCWDDGEPQEAGLGHERMPRNLLVKVVSEAVPEEGDVNAAFEAQAATASNVNEGVTGPTAAPEAAPEPGAQAAPVDNIRRVDAQLQVHWAGRVFDVSKAGVGVGDTVACTAVESGPFVQVRRTGTDGPAYMAPMVRPVEVPPRSAPPDPALTRRKQYLLDRMKVVLRYADGPELNDIEDLLEELINDISRGRYVPGLVAADYELTRKYWIEGSAK